MQCSLDCSLLAGFSRSVLANSNDLAPGFARAPGPTAARALARRPNLVYVEQVIQQAERKRSLVSHKVHIPRHSSETDFRAESLELSLRGGIGVGSPRQKEANFSHPPGASPAHFLNFADDKGANRYDRGFVAARQTCPILIEGHVMSSENPVSPSPEDSRLLTLNETARHLCICRRSLERLIAAQQFPRPLKIGRASRIPRSDVETYLAKLLAGREVAT